MIHSLRQKTIQQLVSAAPSYRIKQINKAVYQQNYLSYDDVTTIPLTLRTRLKGQLGEILSINPVQVINGRQVSKVL